MGFFAVLNDLHKGRDTGSAWARVIDLSAVLMTLVSLTGAVADLFPAKEAAFRVAGRGRRGDALLSGVPGMGAVMAGISNGGLQ